MRTMGKKERTKWLNKLALGVIGGYLLLILFSPLCSQGQAAVDNIGTEYQETHPQTPERFALAGRYAQSLFFNNQQNEALTLLKENVHHAIDLKNNEYAAYLSAVLAIQYRILDDRAYSTQYLDQAKQYAASTSDYEARGYVYYAEGWLHHRDDKEANAVHYFQKAVDVYEAAPKNEQLLGRLNGIYKELASIYLKWREFDLYNKYVNLTLQTAQQQKDPMRLFDAYALMGYMS